MYKTATITYTYGNGLISDSRKEAKGSDADGDLVEDKTAVIRSENLRFLYNGRYGVETGANGLYYMRARYYNPQIKRFINRDIIDGSITDSQSLNKYSYVQGNPISLVDPFGLCAQDYFSRAGHELLDWLGFIFDPADAINFLWYTAEGNAAMAAATAVAIVPAAGSFIAKGTKQAIKAGKKAARKAGEKAAKNATEKAAKKAAKKKLAKEAGKEAAEKGAEKAAKEAAEKATEKTAKETAEKAAEEAAEKGIKSSNTLTDAQKSRLNALENTINDHLTDGDFSGTLRDLQGNPVPNGRGGYFDHLGEMQDSYKSLQKIKKALKDSLKNPRLSDVDRALLQEGLDKANSYINKIEELFDHYGGIN